MEKYRCQGVITVFVSIISVLFLSLICTLAESARVQGARARAAAVVDMGLFSVFGEYEADILERYDVLFLDGAYGTDDFEPERIALRLREYMEYNVHPEKDLNIRGKMQMFPMAVSDLTVSNYMLATDEDGAAFYQQAVRNLKANLGSELAAKYLEQSKEARRQEAAAKEYEDSERAAQENMDVLKEQKNQQESEIAEQETQEAEQAESQEPVRNPLDSIKEIKQQGILNLVMKDPASVSSKAIDIAECPSGRELEKGNMPVVKTETGIIAEGLFQQYLAEHFSCMTEVGEDNVLDYQLEYIIAGKKSDVENLKNVVHRLLLLREGVNFLYAMGDSNMRTQADTLALAIATSLGLPFLSSTLSAALMLGWAYGESLLEVRTLLSGGKIPLLKNRENWKLSLENLGRLAELLSECDEGGGEGQNYEEYLRVLMMIGKTGSYPMRALDMIEGTKKGSKADHWIVKVETETGWDMKSVFLRVPAVFLGTANQGTNYNVKASFAY